MTRIYQKIPLSVDEQVNRLVQRGLRIDDPAAAKDTLHRINYYRLSAYWYIFKRPDGYFRPEGSFEQAAELYEFDRRLRVICFDMIGPVEVSLRRHLTHILALKYGVFAHEDPNNFHPKFRRHHIWQSRLHEETRRSKERFVRHFAKTYTGFPMLPIWVAGELMTLGSISILAKHLKTADLQALAAPHDIPHKVHTSWLHTLTYIRNLCAHHSRLWNRELAVKPLRPRNHADWQPGPPRHRVYGALCMLRHLSKNEPTSDDWAKRVVGLLRGLDPVFHSKMGLPTDWQSAPFWSSVC